jgi:proteasome accessory factor A
MLANDCLRLDLVLANPLHAIRVISQDPTCRKTIELETGNRQYTAADVQRCFVEAADRYLTKQGDNTHRRKVWNAWSDAVEALTKGPTGLATRADWAIKYEFLQAQMDARGWVWSTPQVRELDIKYHQIDPQRSLFSLLQDRGLVERLLTDDEVRQARNQPPQTTRARLRIACLDRYRDQVIAINWGTAVFASDEGHVLRWRWGDPTDSGGKEMERLLQSSVGLEEFARSMLSTEYEQGKENNGT